MRIYTNIGARGGVFWTIIAFVTSFGVILNGAGQRC